MREQPTFADLEYQDKKRKTRREIFLERMDSLIPWQKLEERIRPHYPRGCRQKILLQIITARSWQMAKYDAVLLA